MERCVIRIKKNEKQMDPWVAPQSSKIVKQIHLSWFAEIIKFETLSVNVKIDSFVWRENRP
jgi:hypothetical protein